MAEGDIPFLRETATSGLYENLILPDSAAAFLAALGITVPGDLVTTLILARTYATVEDLLSSSDVEAVSSGIDRVALLGYYEPGDGGGGDFFFRDAEYGELADRGSTFLLVDGRIAQRIIYEEVNVLAFGAKFDMTSPATGNGTDNSCHLDHTDHYGPIQRAINFCLKNRAKRLVLPAGGARITKPLFLGTNTDENPAQAAFCIEGQGAMTNVGVVNAGGTGIFIDGDPTSPHSCLLKLEKSLYRYFLLKDVVLSSIEKNGTTAGITFETTSFSGHRFENVTFFGFQIGFHIPVGSSGSNGEFSTFTDCAFSNLDIAFQNDANQAYQPRFISCGFGLPRGAVLFQFNEWVGGQAIGCTATIDPFFGPDVPGTGGVSHLIAANGTNGDPFLVKGGRFEKVNSVLKMLGGNTENVTFKLSVEECIFTAMNYVTETPLIYKDFTHSDGRMNLSVDFNNCNFAGFPGQIGKSLTDVATLSSARVVFRECDWAELIPINKISTFTSPVVDGDNDRELICYENCTVINNVSPGGSTSVSYPLDRVLSTNTARFTDQRDALPYLPHGGTPDNLLIQSNFGLTNPPTSWDHEGTPFNYIAPLNTTDRYEQYPSGAFLRFDGLSAVSQNIAAINLNAGPYQHVFYQGKWCFLNGAYRFSLRNSVSGETYDQIDVTGANIATWLTPTFITLRAKIGKTSTGEVQLRIEQLTAGINYQQVSWQFVTQRFEGVFTPTTTDAVQRTQLWESYCQTAKILGRLQIPFKPDTFGASLANLLEAESELYISSTTLQERVFTDRWETRPRQDVGDAFPTTGTWPQGFIRWRATPVAGGKVGFICVAGGTPGTWKAFGLIDS